MVMKMRSQRGVTLLITLIMLVLLTLFAVSALNTGTTNLKVVGNMQSRSEALNASQEAIETVLSSPQFITNPANAVPVPCGSANTLCTDVTGDGTPEYTTRLTPQPSCVQVRAIKVSELDLTNTEDLGCSAGVAQQFGVGGAGGSIVSGGDSLCAKSVWEITAVTTSAGSGATVTTVQGVGVRISADEMASSCL